MSDKKETPTKIPKGAVGSKEPKESGSEEIPYEDGQLAVVLGFRPTSWRRVETPEELQRFQDALRDQVGIPVPLEVTGREVETYCPDLMIEHGRRIPR